jgi:hypothetical protein
VPVLLTCLCTVFTNVDLSVAGAPTNLQGSFTLPEPPEGWPPVTPGLGRVAARSALAASWVAQAFANLFHTKSGSLFAGAPPGSCSRRTSCSEESCEQPKPAETNNLYYLLDKQYKSGNILRSCRRCAPPRRPHQAPLGLIS